MNTPSGIAEVAARMIEAEIQIQLSPKQSFSFTDKTSNAVQLQILRAIVDIKLSNGRGE